MKKTLLIIGSLLAASPAIAQVADSSTGEYASTLHKGGSITTPPGCYAKAAQNAADTFWATKGSGQFLLPATVSGWVQTPTTAPNPFVVIDVRPTAKYAAGHIPGSVNIPLDVLFRHESLVHLPTDGRTSIILACQSGQTASMALGALVALGYQSVYIVQGGMNAWGSLPIAQ